MKKAFLFIDILGFEAMVSSKSSKIEKIFEIFDKLNVFKHPALQVVIFSDTILVFNKDEAWPLHYYITYLIEYAQELFYKLNLHNVFFKGIITLGEFNFSVLNNFQAYYGEALIETYNDEKTLDGFGLYINKHLENEVVVFDKVPISEKYHYIFLCQSFVNLYQHTNGKLPIDINILYETDAYFRIDDDLKFFREIEVFKNHFPNEKVKLKYEAVYNIYKTSFPKFFDIFERDGFLPFSLNLDYLGSIDPFDVFAKQELNIE
ncbi:MAG TPA: hypothetical protein VK169_07500 [Saprospiraceae bacterium]|nr:hypothetical protein [Saprospiraceae bacterium]